eukprot:gene17831-biopygen11416
MPRQRQRGERWRRSGGFGRSRFSPAGGGAARNRCADDVVGLLDNPSFPTNVLAGELLEAARPVGTSHPSPVVAPCCWPKTLPSCPRRWGAAAAAARRAHRRPPLAATAPRARPGRRGRRPTPPGPAAFLPHAAEMAGAGEGGQRLLWNPPRGFDDCLAKLISFLELCIL